MVVKTLEFNQRIAPGYHTNNMHRLPKPGDIVTLQPYKLAEWVVTLTDHNSFKALNVDNTTKSCSVQTGGIITAASKFISLSDIHLVGQMSLQKLTQLVTPQCKTI